jgi:hypothetical protein
MNDFDDLDALERDLGPSLRLALRERAAAISDGHRPAVWRAGDNGGPARDADLNLTVHEPHVRELTILEPEPTDVGRRNSRRWMAAAAAVAAIFLLVTVLVATGSDDAGRTNPPAGPGPAPSLDTTDEVSSTSSIPDGEAASGQVTSELLASISWYHDGTAWDTGVLYVYADGRVISIGTGGTNFSSWDERRLTTDGAALVQSELVATGLFEPDGPDAVSLTDRTAVRLDGRLVAATGPELHELVTRVRDLEAWLPADAWVDREPATWEPVRQAICLERRTRSGSQRGLEDPAGVISDLPEPAATILGDAVPWTPEFTGANGNGPQCIDVPNDIASQVAGALGVPVADSSQSGLFWSDTFEAGPPTSGPVSIMAWALLPHGQPAFFGA